MTGLTNVLAENYYHSNFKRNREEFKEAAKKNNKESPNRSFVTEDMIAEGDKVVQITSWFDGDKKIVEGIAVFRLSGGKIVDDQFWGREVEE